MTDSENLATRQAAFTIAQKIIEPLLESYPPTEYRMTTGPAVFLSVPASTTMTPLDQIVNATMSVADWLLYEE